MDRVIQDPKAEAALRLAIAALPLPTHQTDGPAAALSQAGHRYREIVSWTGIAKPGQPGHSTWDAAIAEWRRRIEAYAARKHGNCVIWRERPEVNGRMCRGHAWWRVYSRLVIE